MDGVYYNVRRLYWENYIMGCSGAHQCVLMSIENEQINKSKLQQNVSGWPTKVFLQVQ